MVCSKGKHLGLSIWYCQRGHIHLYMLCCTFVRQCRYQCILISNIFGWYMWSRSNDDFSKRQISRNNSLQNILAWISVIGIYIVVFFMLQWVNRDDIAYMQSWLPWIDAFNTSFFLVATLLMAIKKLENWQFWIIGNIISIPIYASQGLYFTSLQYAVFLILAILGYKEWKAKTDQL